MKIEERRELPSNAKKMSLFFEGSGDPSEMHILLGVAVYDEEGHMLAGVGDIPSEVDVVEDY